MPIEYTPPAPVPAKPGMLSRAMSAVSNILPTFGGDKVSDQSLSDLVTGEHGAKPAPHAAAPISTLPIAVNDVEVKSPTTEAPKVEPKKEGSFWDMFTTSLIDQVPGGTQALEKFAKPLPHVELAPSTQENITPNYQEEYNKSVFGPDIAAKLPYTPQTRKDFAVGAARVATTPETIANVATMASGLPTGVKVGANAVIGAHSANTALDNTKSTTERSMGAANALLSLLGIAHAGTAPASAAAREARALAEEAKMGVIPAIDTSPKAAKNVIEDNLTNATFDPRGRIGTPQTGVVQRAPVTAPLADVPDARVPAVHEAELAQVAKTDLKGSPLAEVDRGIDQANKVAKAQRTINDKGDKSFMKRQQTAQKAQEKQGAEMAAEVENQNDFQRNLAKAQEDATKVNDKLIADETVRAKIATDNANALAAGAEWSEPTIRQGASIKTNGISESTSRTLRTPPPDPDAPAEPTPRTAKPLRDPSKVAYTNKRQAMEQAANRPGWNVEQRSDNLYWLVPPQAQDGTLPLASTAAAKKAIGEVYDWAGARGVQKQFGGKVVGSPKDGFMVVSLDDPTPAYVPPSAIPVSKTPPKKSPPVNIVAERTVTPAEQNALGMSDEAPRLGDNAASAKAKADLEQLLTRSVETDPNEALKARLRAANGGGQPENIIAPRPEGPMPSRMVDIPGDAPVASEKPLAFSDKMVDTPEGSTLPGADQWREVKSGEAFEPGREFRMDISTGKNYVKEPVKGTPHPTTGMTPEEMRVTRDAAQSKFNAVTKDVKKGSAVKKGAIPAQTPAKAVKEVTDQIKKVLNTETATSTGRQAKLDAAGVKDAVVNAIRQEIPGAERATGFAEITTEPGTGGDIHVFADKELVATVSKSGAVKWTGSSTGVDMKRVPSEFEEATKAFGKGELPRIDSDMTPTARAAAGKAYVSRVVAAARHKGPNNVTIDIPGDGTFTIPRTPTALSQVAERVEKEGSLLERRGGMFPAKKGSSPWSGLRLKDTASVPTETPTETGSTIDQLMDTESFKKIRPDAAADIRQIFDEEGLSHTPDVAVQASAAPMKPVAANASLEELVAAEEAAGNRYGELKRLRAAGKATEEEVRTAGREAQQARVAASKAFKQAVADSGVKGPAAEPPPVEKSAVRPDDSPDVAPSLAPTENMAPADKENWIKQTLAELDGLNKKGGEKGMGAIPAVGHVASTAVGALVGSAYDEKHPVRGAVLGGLAGAYAPSVLKTVINEARDIPLDSEIVQNIAAKASEALSAGIKLLPDYQRFSLLMNSYNLPMNMWVGPWGSSVMAALEATAHGDPKGARALKLFILRADKFAKGWWDVTAHGEAGRVIDQSMERAEGVGHPHSKLGKIFGLPGRGMTGGDIAARDLLMEAGFSEAEAREITLTSEPWSALGRGTAAGKRGSVNEFGEHNPLVDMALPFYRTNVNQLEQGAQRTPGLGLFTRRTPGVSLLQDKFKERIIRQAMGSATGVSGYELGKRTDPAAAPVTMKFLQNVSGQYGLPVLIGFLYGQAEKAGKEPIEAIMSSIGSLLQNMPLPTGKPAWDTAVAGKKFITGDYQNKTDLIPTSLKPNMLRDEQLDQQNKVIDKMMGKPKKRRI